MVAEVRGWRCVAQSQLMQVSISACAPVCYRGQPCHVQVDNTQ